MKNWRLFEKDEIIEAGDEKDVSADPWRDVARWEPVHPDDIGNPAPDPQYVSHRLFRRQVHPDSTANAENSNVTDQLRLLPEDVSAVVRALPKVVKQAVEACTPDVFVAGGFVRDTITRQPVNDIDLFVSEDKPKQLVDSLKWFANDAGISLREIRTENAVTLIGLPTPVQVIHRWTFDTPSEAIKSFDFTVAAAAVYPVPIPENVVGTDRYTWDSVRHDRFYADLSARRLVYTSPVRIEELGGSMLRVTKFLSRGYRIPLLSLSKVIARTVSGIRGDVSMSDEKHVANLVHGVLKEVDPFTITESYEE